MRPKASGHQSGSTDRDRLRVAVDRALQRAKRSGDPSESSINSRLAQVGVLGWTIVAPVLVGLFAGRMLDRVLATHVLFSAALMMVGAGVGLWWAWRWMRRQ